MDGSDHGEHFRRTSLTPVHCRACCRSYPSFRARQQAARGELWAQRRRPLCAQPRSGLKASRHQVPHALKLLQAGRGTSEAICQSRGHCKSDDLSLRPDDDRGGEKCYPHGTSDAKRQMPWILRSEDTGTAGFISLTQSVHP